MNAKLTAFKNTTVTPVLNHVIPAQAGISSQTRHPGLVSGSQQIPAYMPQRVM